MKFKLEYTVRELNLVTATAPVFNLDGTSCARIEFRAPNEEERQKGHKREHTFCTVFLDLNPSSKNEGIFTKIAKNQILQAGDEWRQQYTGPAGTKINLPALSAFPEHFQSFLDQVNRDLAHLARRSINLLRWRCNSLGPHNPVSTRGTFWSRDGIFWHPAPASLKVRLSVVSPLRIRPETIADINSLLLNETDEPVHHELYREAWQQRQENPRSSLVTGMSALEVGIKHTIGLLVPNAGWLADNLPSPPIIKILREYIPELPVRNKINGKVPNLPSELLELITKGVTIRNQITHTGRVSPSGDTVEQILGGIKDILWLLDYYSGQAWAYAFISSEVRTKLECKEERLH